MILLNKRTYLSPLLNNFYIIFLVDDITIEDERREVVTNHTNESESSTHTLESTNIVNGKTYYL